MNIGLSTIDWFPPTGPPNGSFVVASGTTLTSAVGNPAVGSTGNFLDLNIANPLPILGFISFPALPGLLFDLTAVGPGSPNTNCASVVANGQSCSAFLGSPFILTLTSFGTAISLSVGGAARDGTLPNSTWVGTITTQIASLSTVTPGTVVRPVDIQIFFGCTAASVGPGGCTNQNAVMTSTHSAEFIVATGALAPPTIIKSFSVGTIPLGGTTSLTFTITNPSFTTTLMGVGFSDTLPAGLIVATPNGLSGSCGGGTITAVAGSNSISLAGATLAASGSCTFSVNVTGILPGVATNTSGNVTSTNGGTGNAAMASITVLAPDLTITKTHSGNFAQSVTGVTYTIIVSNVGTAPTTGTVTVTDVLPTGLTATAISGTGWSCTLATLACTRSDSLAVGSSFPAITITVNVSGTAPSSVTNTATVSGGGDVTPGNNTATDVTAIGGCPPHRTHGHIGTVPPGHFAGKAVHLHHGQHGHISEINCPPHAPGHSPGLMPDPEEGLFTGNFQPAEPEIVAAMNDDGTISSHGAAEDSPGAQFRAARRGSVLLLYGTTAGLAVEPDTLPEVRIGDAPAEVLSSGWSPGLDGVWQIKVLVPENAAAGLGLHVTVIYRGQEWDSIDVAVE